MNRYLLNQCRLWGTRVISISRRDLHCRRHLGGLGFFPWGRSPQVKLLKPKVGTVLGLGCQLLDCLLVRVCQLTLIWEGPLKKGAPNTSSVVSSLWEMAPFHKDAGILGKPWVSMIQLPSYSSQVFGDWQEPLEHAPLTPTPLEGCRWTGTTTDGPRRPPFAPTLAPQVIPTIRWPLNLASQC